MVHIKKILWKKFLKNSTNFWLLFLFPALPGANKIWLVSSIFLFHSLRASMSLINQSMGEDTFQRVRSFCPTAYPPGAISPGCSVGIAEKQTITDHFRLWALGPSSQPLPEFIWSLQVLCWRRNLYPTCIHLVLFLISMGLYMGLPWWLSGKKSTCNAGDARDMGLIPKSGRSPRGGHGNPLQYSCLGNPMDRNLYIREKWIFKVGWFHKKRSIKQGLLKFLGSSASC